MVGTVAFSVLAKLPGVASRCERAPVCPTLLSAFPLSTLWIPGSSAQSCLAVRWRRRRRRRRRARPRRLRRTTSAEGRDDILGCSRYNSTPIHLAFAPCLLLPDFSVGRSAPSSSLNGGRYLTIWAFVVMAKYGSGKSLLWQSAFLDRK